MKALMYHYIRQGSADLPYFRYLHMDDFRAQLDDLAQKYHFISKAEFLESLETKTPIENGIILTFDDGLSDHFQVMEELIERALWGVFYIPTGSYQSKTLLNVHRIHMLIGRFGGVEILAALQDILTQDMVCDQAAALFEGVTYRSQDNDAATTRVKKIINFSIKNKFKDSVLAQLMARFYPDEAALTARYYLTDQQIKEMHDAGMVIGAHSVTHPIFSKLSYADQLHEIQDSFSYIENIVGAFDMKTFCYPHGGDHVFTQDTIDILTAEKCLFSLSVEQKDITSSDLQNRIHALPRYDCNQFPHGRASMGLQRSDQLI